MCATGINAHGALRECRGSALGARASSRQDAGVPGRTVQPPRRVYLSECCRGAPRRASVDAI